MMAVSRKPALPLDPQDEVARLLALMIRKQSTSQTEFIVDLSKIGFPNNRIATLADTTVDTVGATLRSQKKKMKKRPVKKSAAK